MTTDIIKNYELRMANWKFYFRCSLFLCALCVFPGNVFGQASLDDLANDLNRGSVEQKRDALFRIRNIKSPEAARLAVAALSDKSEIVRATAASSVIFLPSDEAAHALLPLLRDKDVLVRKEAAYALGITRSASPVRPLIELIQKDKIQEIKDAATVALGEIGDASAVDALRQILTRRPKDEEEFFRRAAARSIGQIAQFIQTRNLQIVTPENFLPDRFKESIKPEYKNLSETYRQFRDAVPVLIQSLRNARESDDVKREAAFALGAIGDASAAIILQSNLNDEDYYLAEISREALKKLSK